jgi:hypothetical protein
MQKNSIQLMEELNLWIDRYNPHFTNLLWSFIMLKSTKVFFKTLEISKSKKIIIIN